MIAKLASAVKYLLGKDVAGRTLRVFPDDTFVVSYPKSGNTWTRFLIANLVHPQEPVTFLNADRIIPAVDGQSRKYFKKMPRPRIIKSHYSFDPAYKRVIYIVRDPRDVAVSQYHFQIKRQVLAEGHPIERFVDSFVAGETCPYGSWGENVASWLAARHSSSGFLLLRYEDMVTRTNAELTKVASFLGIEPVPELLAQTVERSSADRMRKLEKVQAGKWDSTKGTRKDIPFVRSATSGGWKSALPERSTAEIEAAWGPLMQWLGYDLISGEKSGMDTRLLESVLQHPAP